MQKKLIKNKSFIYVNDYESIIDETVNRIKISDIFNITFISKTILDPFVYLYDHIPNKGKIKHFLQINIVTLYKAIILSKQRNSIFATYLQKK